MCGATVVVATEGQPSRAAQAAMAATAGGIAGYPGRPSGPPPKGSTGSASPWIATIRVRRQPTGGSKDAATVTTAWNLPGKAQAAKAAMSPPSLIPVITTRAGSTHSATDSWLTSADRDA